MTLDPSMAEVWESLIEAAESAPSHQMRGERWPRPRALPPAPIEVPAPTKPPAVRIQDARPLLEDISDFLRQLDQAWIAGKPVKSLLARGRTIRYSIERSLKVESR